jgi:hypothetical protein
VVIRISMREMNDGIWTKIKKLKILKIMLAFYFSI